MMERNEDLVLSLSLGSSANPNLQLNLTPPQWNELLASSSVPRGSSEMAARPMLRGIDVNRETAAERKSHEDAGTSSPNSTLSSGSGKRDHAATIGGGGGGEMNSDEEDGEGCRKKLRLSKDQSAVLEESFNEHNTLTPKEKQALAKQLNLRPRQVEVWFQNRRARTKLKQTEVDCDLLKRCCENLTDENEQLRKEVAQLRALKLSPQFCMNMTLPATLTMCPSCECVAPSNNGAATRPANVDHPYLQHAHNQWPFPIAGRTPAPWAPATSFLDVMKSQLP